MFEILSIVGARPQIIKAAAIARALAPLGNQVKETLLHTGQHYDEMMSAVFFKELGIPIPDINLNVGSGMHAAQTAAMLKGIEEVILSLKPDLVLIYGDTNSTLAAALAAAKTHVPLAHVEAGLRSYNKSMPEEINRLVADHCSSLLFCPTTTAVDNLAKEGFKPDAIPPYSADNPAVMLSGDVMYDNTIYFGKAATEHSLITSKHGLIDRGFHLATVHRDHNTDVLANLTNILEALGEISKLSDMPVILPLHPRTRKSIGESTFEKLNSRFPLLLLIDPVSFLDMSLLEKSSQIVFTDSGGVQKEAFFHGKPVVVLRDETEWVEIVDCGAGILAGNSKERIIHAYESFTQTPPLAFPPIFGDGKASNHIVDAIMQFFMNRS